MNETPDTDADADAVAAARGLTSGLAQGGPITKDHVAIVMTNMLDNLVESAFLVATGCHLPMAPVGANAKESVERCGEVAKSLQPRLAHLMTVVDSVLESANV
jgi:hypothetical protein